MVRGPDGVAPLSEQLWASAATLYQRIIDHPFVTGLQEGDLPEANFSFFLVQDYHFLEYFSCALAALADRAPQRLTRLLLERCSAEAIAIERALHQELLDELEVPAKFIAATPLAPSAMAYGNFLLAVALREPFSAGLAAVLPCYRVYWELGQQASPGDCPHPMYRRWLESYRDEPFGVTVAAVSQLADGLAPALGPTDLGVMFARFQTAIRYEWMFWEMGLNLERWPI